MVSDKEGGLQPSQPLCLIRHFVVINFKLIYMKLKLYSIQVTRIQFLFFFSVYMYVATGGANALSTSMHNKYVK